MFDIGFFELCIIGVVALLVLGPERLPRAARTAGMWVGRAKRMVSQVKRDIDDELRQEELQELREAKDSLSKTRESMDSFQKDLNQQVDTGDADAKKKPSTAKTTAAGEPASKASASDAPKATGPNDTKPE
ncbi:MAG: Sec-independent protein translocase protein TatB [Gammaproteobacteria bacterium]|nr:Sec-independent protein translocase protein TatB [Gammaproteobacteria bacterium]